MAKSKLTKSDTSVALEPRMAYTWDSFWFAPDNPQCLLPIRLVLCLLVAIWLLSVVINTSNWFGADGWNAADLGRRLSVSTEGVWSARFRITPLWMTSSATFIQAWGLVGIALCALVTLGIGQRWIRLALFLNVLWLAQRMTWSSGAVEPYMIALLGYLVIGPSYPWRPFSVQQSESSMNQPTWMTTFSMRLIQVHTFILLCFTLTSLLAADVWWRGEGVWFLAASGHSNLLRPEWLINQPLVVNFLSHAIVISCLLSVAFFWTRDAWRVGRVCAIVTSLSIALIGDQLLYGALLGAVCMTLKKP